jgi:hypothetical protein
LTTYRWKFKKGEKKTCSNQSRKGVDGTGEESAGSQGHQYNIAAGNHAV